MHLDAFRFTWLVHVDEIDLSFLIEKRKKKLGKRVAAKFISSTSHPPPPPPPPPSIRYKSSPIYHDRSRKNRFRTRVYIFWTMACIFLEESFFSRNSCGPARELREYNNSRGWPYLLPRNGAPKNRPHRGVNINACCWRDAV